MRPIIASIHNVPTPYRLAFHRRIDLEMPEVELLSVYTHDNADQPWALDTGDSSRVFRFGVGDSILDATRPSHALAEWRKGGRILTLLRERGVSAVILGGYSDPCRMRLIRACRAAGIHVFLFADSNIHGDNATGARAAVKHVLVRWVVRHVAGLMPCGLFGRQYFEKYGAKPEQIFYSPYEPDYRLIFELPQAKIDATKAKYGFRDDRQRLVFCSRLVDFKRADMAIDAFAKIADARPNLDLIMVGDGPLKREYESRVPAPLRSRVLFTGFIGDQGEISAIYRASHVFVHPCFYEPWGVVINESVAAGMALVSTSTVGAAAELVRDRVNGRTFPPGDLPALTGALLETTDPANLERYRAASAGVLADWRSRGDPVEGVRRALRFVKVL